MIPHPNFFEEQIDPNPWTFEDVLTFIRTHFDTGDELFRFRIGDRWNEPGENARAGIVIAYAILMDFSFKELKALFSEHDHYALALPEVKKGRNILVINNKYEELLREGKDPNIKLSEVEDFFEYPDFILRRK